MRAAMLTLAILTLTGALGGCHKNQPQDQNISVDDASMDNGGLPANADIESLPPDESSATPSNQLANGADNPDVNDLGNTSD